MHLWNDLLLIAPLFVPDSSAPVALGRKRSLKVLNAVPGIPAQEIQGESRSSVRPAVALGVRCPPGQGRGWQGPDPTPAGIHRGEKAKERKGSCGGLEILSICNLFQFH